MTLGDQFHRVRRYTDTTAPSAQTAEAPQVPENEPLSAISSPTASDRQSDGHAEIALQPQGITEPAELTLAPGVPIAATERPHGKPGKSGPPNNNNARKDGASTVRRERKELRQRAINGRTSEGRYVASERADLVASLGGADNLSTQEQWLADEAAFLRLELAYVRAWLAEQSPVNKRKKAAHPILKDYAALVGSLRSVLADLGLKRRARDVGTLRDWMAAKQHTPDEHDTPESSDVND